MICCKVPHTIHSKIPYIIDFNSICTIILTQPEIQWHSKSFPANVTSITSIPNSEKSSLASRKNKQMKKQLKQLLTIQKLKGSSSKDLLLHSKKEMRRLLSSKLKSMLLIELWERRQLMLNNRKHWPKSSPSRRSSLRQRKRSFNCSTTSQMSARNW